MFSVRIRAVVMVRQAGEWTSQRLETTAPTMEAAYAAFSQRVLGVGPIREPAMGQELLVFVGHTEIYVKGEGSDSYDESLARLKQRKEELKRQELADDDPELEILPEKPQ